MPRIEISQENYDRLKALAEPLVDTVDTVLGRLFAGSNGQSNGRPTGGIEQRPTRRTAVRDRKRARKGERTPTEEFYRPLLEVLGSAGGQLAPVEAINQVGRIMEAKLNDVDRARLPSGEVRWRNTVRWAAQRLAEQDKLDKGAPHGVWKLMRGIRP